MLRLLMIVGSLLGVAPATGWGAEIEQSEEQVILFQDTFDAPRTIEEVAKPSVSSDPSWWLQSGGRVEIRNGTARTVQGSLPPDDQWRIQYSSTDPQESRDGFRPQNMFRLLQKRPWGNIEQTVYVKINAYDTSLVEHRDAFNGVYFVYRYNQTNGQLYKVGIRVDGAVVVQKRLPDEDLETIWYERTGLRGQYNRAHNPILIPMHKKIGLRSRIYTSQSSRAVNFQLFVDWGDGHWTLLTDFWDRVRDDGDTDPIIQKGLAGIQTEFMDAEFSDYQIATYEGDKP